MNDTRRKADDKTPPRPAANVPSKNWPFPPPGGPTPWTPAEQRAYQRRQLQQMEAAPW